MSAEQNVDLESLSLEELRRRAEEELQQQPKDVAAAEPKRDEKGRFAAQADDEVIDDEPDAPQEPEKKIYRRVIQIDPDVDPEIFEAESLEELVDMIADAKANATKKIREQQIEIKKFKTKEPPKAPEFSDDQEYVYSQELMSKPTEAFKKMFRDVVGVDIMEIKTVAERNRVMVEAQNKNDTIQHFLTTHPDYDDSTRNGELMQKWMGGSVTKESFEKAYRDLKSRGLLELKSEDADSVQEQPRASKQRIAASDEDEVPPQRTKKASGISTKNRPVPVANNEPSLDDLYDPSKYTTEQIREMAMKNPGR